MPFAERQRARRWTIGLILKVLARFKKKNRNDNLNLTTFDNRIDTPSPHRTTGLPADHVRIFGDSRMQCTDAESSR